MQIACMYGYNLAMASGYALNANVQLNCYICPLLFSEGEDLGDLAVEYSICPSKQEGGLLGWVKKGQMVSNPLWSYWIIAYKSVYLYHNFVLHPSNIITWFQQG